MQAKEPSAGSGEKPLLMVDIDGVISLFGFPNPTLPAPRPGDLDGSHLLSLAEDFDLVWCSGWEEKAEEYLPRLLDLPAGLPFLRFARAVRRSNAHWKLDAIGTYADRRPLAWIDDAFNPACHAWAQERSAPTLLVQTQPEQGLTAPEAKQLASWAQELCSARA